MKKSTARALITAAVLILTGAIIALCALAHVGFDFTALGTDHPVEKVFDIDGEFTAIDVTSKSCSVTICESPDGRCRVKYSGADDVSPDAKIIGGALTVDCTVTEPKSWYEYPQLSTHPYTVTVYLPQREYDRLSVDVHSGDVLVNDVSCSDISLTGMSGNIGLCDTVASGSLSISNESGDIDPTRCTAGSIVIECMSGHIGLTDIAASGSLSISTGSGGVDMTRCDAGSIAIVGGSGYIRMTDAIASGSLSVSTKSGDISLKRCDAGSITIEAESGDVSGSLLSGKIFNARTGSGDITVPQSVSGGSCEITTQSGDINISLE